MLFLQNRHYNLLTKPSKLLEPKNGIPKMPIKPKFIEQKYIDKLIELPALGTWSVTKHVFDEKSVNAINAAIAAQRPLLVRGEPGTGKSQLARAAAFALDRLFVSEVVHARSECQDLLWSFDAVARLADAQLGEALASRYYLSPGVLWWVFDWQRAQTQYETCKHNMRRPEKLETWQPSKGCVLLIDEIDKVDADLPNSLLETLGNGAFSVPYLDEPIGLLPDIPPPLVLISTNEERELPAAFVRRCMVLHLGLPKDEQELIDYLMARGRSHYGEVCGEQVRRQAAEQLYQDRQDAIRLGVSPPGQAEYLDMLKAVSVLAKTEAEQLSMLDKISEFALRKFVVMANQ